MTIDGWSPKPHPTPTRSDGFSRFYTRRIGLLHEGLLGSSLSLAEGRVVYELGSRTTATAAELAGELDLDQGYLSRILRSFDDRDLIRRQPSTVDGRQVILSLTERGQALFTAIDATSRQEIGTLLERLPAIDQARLVAALNTAEALLGGSPETKPHSPIILRSPEAGDIGWVVHRHGALYAAEYGWDWTFEALVAEVAARFVQNFDAARERCWIAARDCTVLGSVFLVRDSDETAPAAPAVCGADRARHRIGPGAGARMPALRRGRGVSENHALDQRRADRRARDLPLGGVRDSFIRPRTPFRQGFGQRDLGAGAVRGLWNVH